MDWESKAIIQELRQEQRKREMWLRFGTPPDQRQRLARIVEARAVERIERHFVYSINYTNHKAAFDLWVGGARVEVKGSNWDGQRYQASVRNHMADVLIFDAINDTDHWFIIPMGEIEPRNHIAIWNYNVAAYSGQWAQFLEAWDVLEYAVKTAQARPKQLDLWGQEKNRICDPKPLVPTEGSKKR